MRYNRRVIEPMRMTAYKRWASQDLLGYNAATDNLVYEVGSMDISNSSLYAKFYYPQPQAAYDLYRYGYSGLRYYLSIATILCSPKHLMN